VTQRPPPQIVACGFPALRSSEHGSQLGIRLNGGIDDAQFRPCQGTALCELLELLPGHFAVLTAPTSGLPPELLGESVDAQETLDGARYAVVVIVAAQVLIADVLLVGHGRMQPVADESLDGLCRSLEARALGSPFNREVALPMARAVVREAQEATGLWPPLSVLSGVSLGNATTLAEARLFGCQFQPTCLQSLLQQLVDVERIGSVLTAEDNIIQIADPRGVALQRFSYPLVKPYIQHLMPVDMAEEHTDTPPLGRTTRSCLNRAIRPHHSGVEPPAKARQHTGLPHPPWHEPHRPRLVQTSKAVAQVGL
jgi:hypothetical protein